MIRPLRIALPKGRLMDQTVDAFARAGLLPDARVDAGRRLVVELDCPALGIPLELLLLKNADVPVYVEHGVAHIGVCGTDVLHETEADVYRPHTFGFGSCQIAIAGREGLRFEDLEERENVRIATKYVRTARAFFASRGMEVDIIELSGSVELAAALGLADAIVDLVETGRTLVENRLAVLHEIGRTRVHLIANRALAHTDAVHVSRMLQVLQRLPDA